jgi:uncharacterized membrane protein
MNKELIKTLCFLVIPLAVCAIIYPFLPNQIPRQFHMDGSVSYIAKEFIFILGFITFIVYLRVRKRNKH